jgi:transposase-like protein/IS1 family transposase
VKSLNCPNPNCTPSKERTARTIIRYGFYKTRWGKCRRYQCQSCGKTFCSTTGTAYHRLQHRHATFDEVASLSVEGLNKSAIARVKQISWNTVHRWLERAAAWSRRFNDRRIRKLSASELQADEIQTIVGGRERPIWIFVVLDVWSRLWPATVIGKRSYRNTLDLFRDLSKRMNPEVVPLITTDGFQFYEKVVGKIFGSACVYGQVIKTRRNDRVVRVERKALIGTGRLKQALRDSEDSDTLNTSFVERLNLTLRQGSAYLGRRTLGQARWKQYLDGHLELLRCHYNFVRPHRALKFGREVRTPAMQAGLTNRSLTLRDIFSSRMFLRLPKNVIFVVSVSARPVTFTPRRLALVA